MGISAYEIVWKGRRHGDHHSEWLNVSNVSVLWFHEGCQPNKASNKSASSDPPRDCQARQDIMMHGGGLRILGIPKIIGVLSSGWSTSPQLSLIFYSSLVRQGPAKQHHPSIQHQHGLINQRHHRRNKQKQWLLGVAQPQKMVSPTLAPLCPPVLEQLGKSFSVDLTLPDRSKVLI